MPAFPCLLQLMSDWPCSKTTFAMAAHIHVMYLSFKSFTQYSGCVAGHQRICGICFEPHKARNMCSAGCAHYFCKDCWRSYIHHAVDDGPTCLNLRCPNPECKIAVS